MTEGIAWDPPLSPREAMVLDRIQVGAACGLCGDLGAVRETTGESVPCLACGRDRPKLVIARVEGEPHQQD